VIALAEKDVVTSQKPYETETTLLQNIVTYIRSTELRHFQ